MKRWHKVLAVLTVILALLLIGARGPTKQQFVHLIAKKFTVQQGGSEFQSQVQINVPTAQPTATPGLLIDNDAVSVPLEIRQNATPIWRVQSDGSVDSLGGNIILENDEEIDNSSDGSVKITDGSNTLVEVTDQGSTGDLNVSGALDVQGGDITMENDETLSNSSDGVIQASEGDVKLTADSTGGNAGAKSEYYGLSRAKMVSLDTMTNGTTETTQYMDDTPDGEWGEIGTSDIEVGADTTYYRVGSKSLVITTTETLTTGDGVEATVASDDLEANESIGFWIYSTNALSAGDWEIELDDDTASPDPTFNVPAVATANKWTWVEVDISGLTGGDGDAITKVKFQVKAAGAGVAGNIYLDNMYKWDSDEEEALGTDILQDGVISVMSITAAQDQANEIVSLTENTDFLVHYEDGNDYLVTITDQSAEAGIAMVAY